MKVHVPRVKALMPRMQHFHTYRVDKVGYNTGRREDAFQRV